MCPGEDDQILDVGGEVGAEQDSWLHLLDVHPWKHQITVINTFPPALESIKRRYPEVRCVLGDARLLPWPDKHFDIVYSNAVLEHVGGFQDQKKMATEIMRVGRRWFVATPNRWYPYEFHIRLPLVTWLPWHGYCLMGSLVSYNHVKGRYVLGKALPVLRLVSARELSHLFPGSKIIKHRITFMAETLIAVGGPTRT